MSFTMFHYYLLFGKQATGSCKMMNFQGEMIFQYRLICQVKLDLDVGLKTELQLMQ